MPVFVIALALVVAAITAVPGDATFSGTNGRISFNQDVPGGVEIFSAAPDGTDQQQLTSSGPGKVALISDWSPDGMEIAFDSDRIDQDGLDDVVQIYAMPWNGETIGLRQLTVGPGFHGNPGWSPDGAEIAIEADWGGYPSLEGIWIISASDPDGVTQGEAQRVTNTPAGMNFDSEPQFSPDAQWIAFTRFKDCRAHGGHGPLAGEGLHPCTQAIFIVRPNGSGLRRLTPWGLQASDPDWSPDGTKIIFDSCDSGRHGCKGDIYLMNADGTHRTRLTSSLPSNFVGPNDVFDFRNNPVWAPDATKIMYTHFRGDPCCSFDLVTSDPDGSGEATVVGGPGVFANKADWGTHP